MSLIPGGNPVAKADPDMWALTYVSCKECGQLYCDQCSDEIPLCPECKGSPVPPSREKQIWYINTMCRNLDRYTVHEIVSDAWAFVTSHHSTVDKIQYLQDTFPTSTMKVLVQMAALQVAELADEGPDTSLRWAGGNCWDPKTPHTISREFVEALASQKLD